MACAPGTPLRVSPAGPVPVVGRPLRSEWLSEPLLPKKLALPVFCSDPLSSNACATEEILRALGLGGLALLAASALLLALRAFSQGCTALTGVEAVGYRSVGFLLVQGFTAAILALAANTAFNGFPILASILGHDLRTPLAGGARRRRRRHHRGVHRRSGREAGHRLRWGGPPHAQGVGTVRRPPGAG